MAALEELELGIDHIRNAFKRADNGFTNAYKMLEAQQQRNHKLEDENARLKSKLEVLKAHGIEIADAIGGGHEIYNTRQREFDRLEHENERLREFATDLYRHWSMEKGRGCLGCRYEPQCDALCGCRYELMARGLGIEMGE